MPSYSLAQQKALAMFPHITGFLSILGSGYVVQSVLRDPEKRRKVYHRILLAMCLGDVINTTFGYFLSTWPIPKGAEGVYGAAGNDQTCTFQGFFTQTVLTTPWYNVFLSIYYVLVIVYKWKEENLRKVEPIFHVIAIGFGWGTAIAGIPLELYGNASLWCWISASYPAYRWGFAYGPIWFCIFVAMVSMGVVIWYVLQQERALDKYQLDGQQRQRTQSRRVAAQAFWYLMAFLLTWFAATLTRAIQLASNKVYYPIILQMAIFLPAQGFLNFLVYIRPRILSHLRARRAANNDKSASSTGRLAFSSIGWLSRISRSNERSATSTGRLSSIKSQGPPMFSGREDCTARDVDEVDSPEQIVSHDQSEDKA